VTAAAAARGRGSELAALAIGLAAAVFLVTRPAFERLGAPTLAIGYVALGAASAWVAVPHARERGASTWMPLGVGLAAVLAARLAAGPAPALPVGLTVIALDVGAAVAEEAFFRGFLFGRLETRGVAVAVAGSALAFAFLHVPLYGWAAFPVDLGAGLLFSWQRAASGRWSVPAATHAFANLVAVLR